MSVAEVAEILGKRPNAVKALQFRGLIALRRALEDTP
jgi:DNA-directed RNA polymerase specialized sigma24 family protein